MDINNPRLPAIPETVTRGTVTLLVFNDEIPRIAPRRSHLQRRAHAVKPKALAQQMERERSSCKDEKGASRRAPEGVVYAWTPKRGALESCSGSVSFFVLFLFHANHLFRSPFLFSLL